MNIFYLSGARLPSNFASSVQVTRMCHEFVRQGHGVHLFGIESPTKNKTIYEWYGISENINVSLHAWPGKRAIGTFFYSFSILREIRTLQKPDLFYARQILCLFLVRNLGVPLIYEAHMPSSDPFHRWMQWALFRSSNFQRLITVSHKLAAQYQKDFPFLPPEKILVAPNGADDILEQNPKPVSLPGRKGVLRVGYIGSLHPRKGFVTLLESARRMPDVDFYVAGAAHDITSVEGKGMFPPNLHMLGFIPPSEIRNYVVSFDLVLAPYQNGDETTRRSVRRDDTVWGSPLKIFEYLSAGACIIASDLPIIRELLVNEENSILCSPGNAEEWVNAIRRLSNDEGLRERLKRNAREHFLKKYKRSLRAKNCVANIDSGGVPCSASQL